MRLRLPTAHPAHSHRLHDLLPNMGRSGTRQQISPTFAAEVLQFKINSCTATCQIQVKECFSLPKWLRMAVIMLQHFILLFQATGILVYADLEIMFLI